MDELEPVMGKGFLISMGVAVISDGLDVIASPITALLDALPIPGFIPTDLPGQVRDAITRAVVENQQGGSVLRELISAPIETLTPIAPGHTLSVLLGEVEKRFFPQLVPP